MPDGKGRARLALLALGAVLALAAPSRAEPAAEEPAYGAELEGFAYPFPVQRRVFTSQGQQLAMAYMDVQPDRPNGGAVVLLHGKNFCAATWEQTIKVLAQAGYRVIAPDQIGFCKSDKPARYQYSFQQLAHNTHALLASLGVPQATLIGHSTGGMLAVRYALMYPQQTAQLVLVNPIGLEDWKAKGVPALTIDAWQARERANTADAIRLYEQATYYAGNWKPEYERWVGMLAGMLQGPGQDEVASSLARLDDMIFNQPVVYEFGLIRVPTLLLIGDKDTTAIGKDLVPPAQRALLGRYPALAKAARAAIPGATLVEFADMGHAPQIQDPAAFHAALLHGLDPGLFPDFGRFARRYCDARPGPFGLDTAGASNLPELHLVVPPNPPTHTGAAARRGAE